MAGWTDIADSVLESGKIIAATLMRGIRDNFAAMAQGAENAPRITAGSLLIATESVTIFLHTDSVTTPHPDIAGQFHNFTPIPNFVVGDKVLEMCSTDNFYYEEEWTVTNPDGVPRQRHFACTWHWYLQQLTLGGVAYTGIRAVPNIETAGGGESEPENGHTLVKSVNVEVSLIKVYDPNNPPTP